MVISPRARRYLVAAIYISLSTAPLPPSYFAYNELRRSVFAFESCALYAADGIRSNSPALIAAKYLIILSFGN